ncbi:MAG TPA: OmpA family protein, partial [Fibrobacteraceae bacterium]|nr:OmpA family protein [Fibrobacteraceae bacterium]
YLEPLKQNLVLGEDIGKRFNINPIYFDLDKSDIRPDAAIELDKIVQIMNAYPDIVIELGSHTDCRAPYDYNMALSERRAKASADYIRNDSSWYNSLAQSPSFIANRIMNSDKDGNLSKYGVYAPLYSSFDALYFFTPKHAPASTNLKNDEMENGQTESYNIAPYSKTSWGSNAYTRKELALIDQLSDASIQMALPNGLATANRTGIRANVLAGYGKDNMIEVQGLFTKLDQVEGIGSSKISYTEYGGGAKIDVFALIGVDLPLELSGSYKHSERSIEKAEFTSDFINVGLYVRYLKRLGIAAGFQMINSELNTTAALSQSFRMSNLKVDVAPILKGTQKQWMVGLDYTLAPHAWLAINYGQTMVSNKYYTAGLVDASGVVNSETNLPDYISGINAESNAQTIKHEFTRDIIQATINVEF